MGAKVTRLIEEDGRVVGVSGLRHGKEPFEVRADVVVGADGRYSTIARLGRVRAGVRAPRLRRHLVHHRAAAGLVQHLLRLARRRARAHAAEVSAPHPGRDPAADRRVEALAPGGRDGRWPSGCGASTRSSPPFADRLTGLHAVLPAGGHHPLRAGVGTRRPAADRRRRPHHEPGRRHRRQRGAGHGGGGRAGDLSAPRPGSDRQGRPARRPALREADVRTLHRLQLGAQRVLLGQQTATRS